MAQWGQGLDKDPQVGGMRVQKEEREPGVLEAVRWEARRRSEERRVGKECRR